MDRPQRERPRHRPARAVRLPRRVAALPVQPDPRDHEDRVPAAARRPPAARRSRRARCSRRRPSWRPGSPFRARTRGPRPGRWSFETDGATQVWPLDLRRRRQDPGPHRSPRAGRHQRGPRTAAPTPSPGPGCTSRRPGHVLRDDRGAAPTRPRRIACRSTSPPRSTTRCGSPCCARTTTDLAALAGPQPVRRRRLRRDRSTGPFALQDLDAAEARPAYAAADLTRRPAGHAVAALERAPVRRRRGASPPSTVGDDTTRGLVTDRRGRGDPPAAPLPVLDPASPAAGRRRQPAPARRRRPGRRRSSPGSRSAGRRPSTSTTRSSGSAGSALNAVAGRAGAHAPAPELLGHRHRRQRPALPAHPAPGARRHDLRLQVEERGGWQDWTEVDSFVRQPAGGPALHRRPRDGRRATSAAPGCRSSASGSACCRYRYGGGVAGNVPAGALTALSGVGGVDVANPLPAAGGADAAATLSEALDAIPADVHRRDRAWSPTTSGPRPPGDRGRPRRDAAAAAPRHTPPCARRAWSASWSSRRATSRRPEAPLPDLDLLRRVARYLDVRRLVTTELYVIPPTYVRDRGLDRARGQPRLPGRRRAPLGGADPAPVPRRAAAVRPGRRGLAARAHGAGRRAGGRRGAGRGRRVRRRLGAGPPRRRCRGAGDRDRARTLGGPGARRPHRVRRRAAGARRAGPARRPRARSRCRCRRRCADGHRARLQPAGRPPTSGPAARTRARRCCRTARSSSPGPTPVRWRRPETPAPGVAARTPHRRPPPAGSPSTRGAAPTGAGLRTVASTCCRRASPACRPTRVPVTAEAPSPGRPGWPSTGSSGSTSSSAARAPCASSTCALGCCCAGWRCARAGRST